MSETDVSSIIVEVHPFNEHLIIFTLLAAERQSSKIYFYMTVYMMQKYFTEFFHAEKNVHTFAGRLQNILEKLSGR